MKLLGTGVLLIIFYGMIGIIVTLPGLGPSPEQASLDAKYLDSCQKTNPYYVCYDLLRVRSRCK